MKKLQNIVFRVIKRILRKNLEKKSVNCYSIIVNKEKEKIVSWEPCELISYLEKTFEKTLDE